MSTTAGNQALGEVRKVLHGVRLDECPALLREKLAQYDTNGNGIIDPNELPDPMSAEMTYLKVASFPKDLHPLLHEIDDEKNGKIEMDELTEILTVYVDLKKANKEGSIAIKTLPKEIQPTLKVFDVDGDGTVAPMELARGAELYKESKKTAKRLMIFSGVLLVILCALVGVIVGLTAVVVEESKETKTGGSGITTVKGSDKPAATAAVVKSMTLFDAPKMSTDQLNAMTALTLTNSGKTYKYTITGFETMPGSVTFFAARGDKIVASFGSVIVKDAAGKVKFTEFSSAASKQRRRNLLAAPATDESEAKISGSEIAESPASQSCESISVEEDCKNADHDDGTLGPQGCAWAPVGACDHSKKGYDEYHKLKKLKKVTKDIELQFDKYMDFGDQCASFAFTESMCSKAGGGTILQHPYCEYSTFNKCMKSGTWCKAGTVPDYDAMRKMQFSVSYITSGRVECKAPTECKATEYEVSWPTTKADRVCKAHTECKATEYETKAPTATTDRQCMILTSCKNWGALATEYEAKAPTATSDRACRPLTVCKDDEYELVAPTPKSDRKCTYVGKCKDTPGALCMAKWQSKECTPDSPYLVNGFANGCTNCDEDEDGSWCMPVGGGKSCYCNDRKPGDEDDDEPEAKTSGSEIAESMPQSSFSDKSRLCQESFSVEKDCVANPLGTPGWHIVEGVLLECFWAQADGVCKAHTECKATEEYEAKAPTATTDRQCMILTSCKNWGALATEYEAKAPTATSDRACMKLTQECAESNEWKPPAKNAQGYIISDRICSSICKSDQYYYEAGPSSTNSECRPLTVCKDDEYELVAPTPKSDRKCTYVGKCKDTPGALCMAKWQSKECTPDSPFLVNGFANGCTNCDEDEDGSWCMPVGGGKSCYCNDRKPGDEDDDEPEAKTSGSEIAESMPQSSFSDKSRLCQESFSVEKDCVANPLGTPGWHIVEGVLLECFWAQADGVCKAHTECKATEEYEAKAPTATTDRQCMILTSCKNWGALATEYEAKAPTATSDRACMKLTQECAESNEWKPPAKNAQGYIISDRICSSICKSDQYYYEAGPSSTNSECRPLTVCKDDEYELVAPTPKSDRKCTYVGKCKDTPGALCMAKWQSKECTPDSPFLVNGFANGCTNCDEDEDGSWCMPVGGGKSCYCNDRKPGDYDYD